MSTNCVQRPVGPPCRLNMKQNQLNLRFESCWATLYRATRRSVWSARGRLGTRCCIDGDPTDSCASSRYEILEMWSISLERLVTGLVIIYVLIAPVYQTYYKIFRSLVVNKLSQLFVNLQEINMLELSASDRQMALNEVKIMAKMDHPNIVGFHDSFEKDGVLMIEMEYADGGNLQEFLAKRKT